MTAHIILVSIYIYIYMYTGDIWEFLWAKRVSRLRERKVNNPNNLNSPNNPDSYPSE